MTLEIRPCRPGELAAGLTPIFHFFGRTPTEERHAEDFGRVLPPERLHAAWEDGRAVGGAGAFPFRISVPGGSLSAAGVTTVGVLPTHRRRGILSRMMRAQLDDVYARGEPIAYLWASEGLIYGRFGYGVASLSGDLEILRTRAGFADPVDPVGEIRLVSVQEALETFPQVYDRVAAVTPGMFGRSREWWEARVLADPEWRRFGGGEQNCVLLEADGQPAGYALYRLHPGFAHGSSTGHTSVLEAMATTGAATRQLWRFLLDVDWMDSLQARLLPVDHPLFLLLAEPRRMRFTLADALWLRLVDVQAALSGRSYGGDGSLVLELSDDFCPWNAGRWKLEGGEAARTDAEPDLRLSVGALGSAYLGGFSLSRLAEVGRVAELRPGALARADALFATPRAPWCPEIF